MTVDWKFDYPSQRMPVFARNVVATSQPLATQAGIRALGDGGNAIDAALAAAIALTVVEPCNNGIGSDAFAILWDGQQLAGLNSSGRAPAAWTPERFSGQSAMPVHGWDSVTVPGCVAAWKTLSDRYGVLPFERLFEDAIHYAESGFQVGPITGVLWQMAVRRFSDFPAFQATFAPDGAAPEIGAAFRMPDHAETLREIARTGGESFYRGELAAAIAAAAAADGGAMTTADLAAHQADWSGTIQTGFNGTELHEIPPNGQGLAALIALGILRHTGIATLEPDSADAVHLMVEATKIGVAEAAAHVSDYATLARPVSDFLDDDQLAAWAERIGPEAATGHDALPTSPDTVYLTAADAGGRMVSLIQSNYMGFGSGIVVPGTGISMQNRGHGFSLDAGHPNQVGPGKRPFHTIIPGFVTSGGAPRMSFGVMGGPMQPQGHLQMMVRIFLWRQNPQAASDAPRWQYMADGELALESGFDPGVVEALKARGHRVAFRPAGLFGGAQLVYRMADGYCAASDSRKEGHAAGF